MECGDVAGHANSYSQTSCADGRLWSISVISAPICISVLMPELLTTDEAANYLRLSERKLYELVANRAVPCSKVTGRWLFPRAALDRWVTAGLIAPAAFAHVAAPPIVGGSHDPLLEWALRESGCGLASLPEGSEEGLRRLTRGEVMVAAIHLHAIERDDEKPMSRPSLTRRDCTMPS